jgi:hypothetical protein
MDVDSCIIAYTKLSRDIFERRGLQYWGGGGIMAWKSLRGTAWFDATRLVKAIQEILEQRLSRDEFENSGGNVQEIMLLDPLADCCKT